MAKKITAFLDKWLSREWVRWIIAGLLGAALTGLIWLVQSSFQVGNQWGSHVAEDKQKWAQNDKEHADFKQTANLIQRMDGKLDVLLRLQTGSKQAIDRGESRPRQTVAMDQQ